MKNQTEPTAAVQQCHDILQWMIPCLDKFPRNRRFTLGERLEGGLLSVLSDLVEASYSRRNASLLASANRQLAVVRHIWRLGFELNTVNRRQYQHGARLMVDLGRQIGGWHKAAAGR